MLKHLALLPAAALISMPSAAQAPISPMVAANWQIGPVINQSSYSIGMPETPTQGRGGSWYIDLPRDPASVHYVTFPHGSLAGKRQISIRYRIETARGVTIHPTTSPGSPAILTLYFQQAGDNWSGRRRFETYRWYATFASHRGLTAGEYTMTAPLDGNWTAVQTSSRSSNMRGFQAAVQNAERVGFVLGGGDGYGHGIYADGRARLTILDFRVQ